jgi:hypothetical protein
MTMSVNATTSSSGSLADLNSLVSPPSDLHLNVASDINDRGEIAGFGFLLNGEERAFLLIPCDENHPNIAGCDYDLVVESSTATAPIQSCLRKHQQPRILSCLGNPAR